MMLIYSDSKANVIQLSFVGKQDLWICKTNIGAQKIEDSSGRLIRWLVPDFK